MASFPESLLDDDDDRAVRLVALALLSDAAAQRERLSQLDDPEALHDFRVAVRRLRSWLTMHANVLGRSAPKRAMRWLRRLARATNRSRDAEVLAAWLREEQTALTARQKVGAAWMLRRLAEDRTEGDVGVMAEVARDFARAHALLEERVPRYLRELHVHEKPIVPTFAAALSRQVRFQASRLRRRLGEVRSIDDDAAAHRARIAGKRLRYLLEPVVPHVPGGGATLARLKSLQDSLGDFHDAIVWQEVVRGSVERAVREEELGTERAARPGAAATAGTEVRRSRRRSPRPGLVAILAHIQERMRATYETVVERWCGDGAEGAALFEGIEVVATALDARAASGIEIERKYLLRGVPPGLEEARVKVIEQGYLPGDRLVERVRRVQAGDDERFYRTVKLGTGVARVEVEEGCTRELFDALWPLTAGRRVSKRRYVVPDGHLTWEVDVFTDRLLQLAEVELPSADVSPDLPAWLAPVVEREVTGDPAYVNANLAS